MKEKGMKEEKESQGVMWFCGSAVPWFCSFEADIEFCGCVCGFCGFAVVCFCMGFVGLEVNGTGRITFFYILDL